MPKTLAESDLESFRRDGYLCPLAGLAESEAAAALGALEAFERRHGGFGKRLRFKAHLRLGALMAIARHERILDAVEDLIGPDILLFTSTLWPKDGNDGRFVSWHQDSAYFGLTPHEEVTAWIALTPSNRSNGCVRVMPGTHLGIDFVHDQTRAANNLLIRGQSIRGLDDARAAHLELRPGEFSLHQERTVHGSLPK
jgi:chlorinating enzyme